MIDSIYDVLSFLVTAFYVVAGGFSVAMMLYMAYRIKFSKGHIFSEDSISMGIFRSLNYDEFAEEYFKDGPKECTKERMKSIYATFFKFLFLAFLAKSVVAAGAICIVYFVITSLDATFRDYFYPTYYEEVEEEEPSQ